MQRISRSWSVATESVVGAEKCAMASHQLQECPIADHDDGPDALEMALRLATEMLAGTTNDGLGNRLPVG